MLTSTVDALQVKELLECALGSLRAVIQRGTTQMNGTGEGTVGQAHAQAPPGRGPQYFRIG